jgi:hypothetical protein
MLQHASLSVSNVGHWLIRLESNTCLVGRGGDAFRGCAIAQLKVPAGSGVAGDARLLHHNKSLESHSPLLHAGV